MKPQLLKSLVYFEKIFFEYFLDHSSYPIQKEFQKNILAYEVESF